MANIIARLREEQLRRPPDPFNLSIWSPPLQELFRPPYDIMSPLLWDEARAEGKEKEKWIMFNLQDMREFRCHALNRDIWRELKIKKVIKQNFIFLHCLEDDPRALQYMTVYFPHRSHGDPAIELPHVSIVDPCTGEQVKVWSGEPFPKSNDFLLQLYDFLSRYSLAADGEKPVAEPASRPKVVGLDHTTEEEKLEMALQIEWESSNSSSSASRPGLVDPDLYTPSPTLPTRSTPAEKGKEPAYSAEAAEDPSDSAQYQYTDLTRPEELFRLLTLHPASERGATIECSLAVAALPQFSCTYEALSYAWGPQSTEHRIKVDECWVRVTSNLHNALRRIRHDARPRTLWIDAICINQANPEEKNHQVKQMRVIYSCASRVLIWLSESDEDIDTALEYLQRPGVTSVEKLDALVEILRNQGSAEILLNEGSVPLEMDMLLVRGLRKLYNKPWWTRMWVVQELFAAAVDPLVICGDKTIDWWLLSDLLGEISRQRLIDRRIAEVSANTFSSFRLYLQAGSLRHESKLTLEHLLDGTQAHDATDPRDHVYALLGLVSDDRAELFQADYTRPVRVAYQHAMVHMFRSRQDLALLANASGEDTVDIPSWCIDFSSKNWRYDALESGVSSEEWRTAPAASRGRGLVEIFHDMEAGTIRLRGTRVGIIRHAVESKTGIMRQLRPAYRTTSPGDLKSAPVKDTEELLKDIGTFHFLACLALNRRYGEDATTRKVAAGDIWKIAAGGLEFNSLLDQEAPLPPGQNGFGSLERFAQRLNPTRAKMLHPWSQHLPTEPINFEPLAISALTKIALYTGNKSCYFTTDESFVGLAYHPVRKGDILCILFGCKYPVVLRRQDGTHYKFIAPTYTDGIMEGEFLGDGNLARTEEFVLV